MDKKGESFGRLLVKIAINDIMSKSLIYFSRDNSKRLRDNLKGWRVDP